MEYYTVKEASEKLGIERHLIMRLVKTGKVESIKGEEKRSPYKITKTELEKIREITSSKKEGLAKK